jgi:carbamoyltransferase
MVFYLGINFGHGSSVALIDELGNLVFALEEGKLIGDKDTSDFPMNSLNILMERFDLKEFYLAEGWDIYRRFLLKGVYQSLKFGIKDKTYFSHRLKKETNRFLKGLYQYYNLQNDYYPKKIDFVGHHLSHAYSLLPIGLKPHSLVFISDTTSEYESISTFYWTGITMRKISYSPFPNSVGSIFHQLAYHLGFNGRNAPGTLMALSAYGTPIWYDDLQKLVLFENDKDLIIDSIYPIWKIKKAWLLYAQEMENSALKNEINQSYNNYEKGINLASSMQKWFTETTWSSIVKTINFMRNTLNLKIDSLGLAGGCALNCQANGEFLKRMEGVGLNEIIVSPWSDDAGTSIGAACKAYLTYSEKKEIQLATPFLGHLVNLPILKSIDENIELAAEALKSGHVLALISQSLEFGPRALGNRCIIASPLYEDTKKKLNEIKQRHHFMPFAPVTFMYEYQKYFEGIPSKYMQWTSVAKLSSYSIIPSGIHKNGTARVQVIDDDNSTLLSKILKKFQDKTGVGVLLLTSLNQKGKPFNYFFKDALITAKELHLYGAITDEEWVVF